MTDKKLTKEERLAAALRANLRKRKAGMSEKASEEPVSDPGSR
jgi:hypothetical protein